MKTKKNSLKYEDGKEFVKSKDKYLDPIKNNNYGSKDRSPKKINFHPKQKNTINIQKAVYSSEYEAIYDFLLRYEALNKEEYTKKKLKKAQILNVWKVLKLKFDEINYMILFDCITDYFDYDSKKFYKYIDTKDQKILWDELKETLD